MSVSIRQVAKAAGVSITTVSHVLNGKGAMRAETRQKVQKVIADLGYLRKRQTGDTLAFVTTVSYGFGHKSIRQAAAEHGFSIKTVICSDQLDLPPPFDADNNIAGVILFGGRWKTSFLEQMITSYTTVLLGSYLPTIDSDAVWVDNAGGIYAATDYLIRQGHRYIGLINGPENSVTSAEKRIGFERAMRRANLQQNGTVVGTAYFSIDSGKKAALQLLSGTPRPTAIIAGETAFGLAVLAVCQESGLQIPADVSLITFHDDPRLAQSTPPITGINIPELAICRAGLSCLVNRINNPAAAGQRVLLQPAIIHRESVCAPRQLA